MIYGYGRVSTTDQDLDIQEQALKRAGCDVIRMEKASGTKLDGRPELKAMLDFIRQGDVLVVMRIDRLARSVNDLSSIVKMLRDRGADLKAIEQPIDTSGASGRAFLNMLATFAEFETDLRKERQLEGIARAKANGVYKGGKKRVDDSRVRELLKTMGPAAVARELRISRSSVYRVIEEDELAEEVANPRA